MRTFYMLSAVQMVSSVGSAITGIAIGFWIFEQTGDVTPVLLVAFFSSLPLLLAGAFAGVLIDRWEKRRILILSDVGQAAGTLMLLFSLVSGQFSLWLLYGVILWQSLFAMFQPPAMLTLITTLVPENQREQANAIQQTIHRIAGIAAPGITGLIYIITGLSGILLIDFATFLLAVTVTWFIVPPQSSQPPKNQDNRPSILRDTMEGIRFLRSHRALFGLILHGTIMNFFLSGVLTLTTPYILRVTGSEQTTGLTLSAFNPGAVAGAVLIAVWGGTRPRIHTIMPAILLLSVAVIMYGIARTPHALVIAAFCILLPMPCVTTLIPAVIQSKTPLHLQGRVFALVFQLASLANPVSLLLTGYLVDHILEPGVNTPFWRIFVPVVGSQPGSGMRLFIIISGTAMFLVTLCFYASPAIRQVEETITNT